LVLTSVAYEATGYELGWRSRLRHSRGDCCGRWRSGRSRAVDHVAGTSNVSPPKIHCRRRAIRACWIS